MSLRSVQRLEQECDEILVCTGVNLKDSGIQYWGQRRDLPVCGRQAPVNAARRGV